MNTLVIYADQGKDVINKNIYGHFAEHLGAGYFLCFFTIFKIAEENKIYCCHW